MASTRASKRRRKNQNHEEEDQKDDTPPPPTDHDSLEKKKNNSPVVVFAHGAGAPSSSDWMIRFHSFYIYVSRFCVLFCRKTTNSISNIMLNM